MFRFLFACMLLLGSTTLSAGEAQERLSRFFTDVATMSGRFEQTVRDETGELIQEASGEVQLLRPGRFRWDYERPFKQQIVSNGQYLWVYDSELAQASVRPLAEALGAAPIMLLSEPRPLNEDFVVVSESTEGDIQWLELAPKVRDTDFVRIHIGLDKSGIHEMRLYDQFGQQTAIRFKDLELNGLIPASRFRFKVPAGVDVIGSPQG